MLCRERVSAAVAAAPDKDAGKKAEADERVKVFEEICRDHVGADILTRYVHATVKVSGVDYMSKSYVRWDEMSRIMLDETTWDESDHVHKGKIW